MRANTYFDYVTSTGVAFKDDRISDVELHHKVYFLNTNSYQNH